MTVTSALPLPTLLSRVLGHLTAEVERVAGVGPEMPSLAVWANVLRCVSEAGAGGIDERELPAAARISKRLATAAITGSARRGWITTEPLGRGKNRRARLAAAGRSAAEEWPARLAELDEPWAGTELRARLEALVSRLRFELPHFPASYGAADPSAVGGPFVQPWTGPEDEPAHGQDWRPVARDDGDTVSGLPVIALLSQALMAFTIDYETRFPWPLASTATVLCHLGSGPVPLAEVPGDHEIKGNGKTLLERHLIVSVTADPAGPRRKLVALTDRGEQVVHHHPGRLTTVEAAWRERYGDELVGGLRAALEPVAAGVPPDVPDHVVAPLHEG